MSGVPLPVPDLWLVCLSQCPSIIPVAGVPVPVDPSEVGQGQGPHGGVQQQGGEGQAAQQTRQQEGENKQPNTQGLGVVKMDI